MGKELLEELHKTWNRPGGPVPIKGTVGTTPIKPVERWLGVGKGIQRTYRFGASEELRRFIDGLLEYEENCGHPAEINIKGLSITLFLITEGADCITEIDKEYARFADMTYRDIVRSPYDNLR